MPTNRHKTKMCAVCGKFLRSDKLKHHMEANHESETSGEMVVQSSKEILERELFENNEAYVKHVAIGEQISTILTLLYMGGGTACPPYYLIFIISKNILSPTTIFCHF